MSSPYDYPEPDQEGRPPVITAISVIAAAFLVFVAVQVAVNIDKAEGRLDEHLKGVTVQNGERISYHYSAYLPDGTLVQTTDRAVAERASESDGFVIDEGFQYGPREATINATAPGLGWGAEADGAVVGARLNTTVTFTVPADLATGDWQPWPPGQGVIPRSVFAQDFERVIFLQEAEAAQAEGAQGDPNFDFDRVDEAIGPLETGGTFNAGRHFPPTWDISFLDVNRDNRSILYRQNVEDGQYFDVPGMPGGITVQLHDDETWVDYRLDLEEGGTFVVRPQSEFAEAQIPPGSILVQEVTDDQVRLMHNPTMVPAAVGQPLTIHLTPIEKLPASGGGGTVPIGFGDDHDPTH